MLYTLSSSAYSITTTTLCCPPTQHGISFSTHGVVECPNAPDFILSKIPAAVFGEGRVVINRVHGCHGQPLRSSDEVRGDLQKIQIFKMVSYKDLKKTGIYVSLGDRKAPIKLNVLLLLSL